MPNGMPLLGPHLLLIFCLKQTTLMWIHVQSEKIYSSRILVIVFSKNIIFSSLHAYSLSLSVPGINTGQLCWHDCRKHRPRDPNRNSNVDHCFFLPVLSLSCVCYFTYYSPKSRLAGMHHGCLKCPLQLGTVLLFNWFIEQNHIGLALPQINHTFGVLSFITKAQCCK